MSPFRTFVDRPVLAMVVSILILIVGGISYGTLPVSEYPDIAPPTISVTASYPGASAETVAETVATPLEQAINGVEGMIYMLSQSTGNGGMSLTITFAPGTDIDAANVLVQNRVARAEPSLPEPVRRLGVSTLKSSSTMLMVVNILSPDKSRDQLYLSNYARTQIVDRLARIDGVGEAQLFAERAFSMRVWLDPDLVAARGMSASDVVAALAANNTQVAAGTIGQLPQDAQPAQELVVETRGRLSDPAEFADIVIRRDGERLTRLRDVARVELGAQDFGIFGYQGVDAALPIAIYQRPGSNALAVANAVLAEFDALSADFPPGVSYDAVYNPTVFIEESVNAVYVTIAEAVALVVAVVLIFLQSARASVIPILAIPISLVGTFAVMAALGFSLNTLTLFGLVLVIGIVVDDAIVVVENVERFLKEGLSPKEAARRTMDEVGGALIAIGLVLAAVFVPAAFVSGVTGIFYRQFAMTIATATLISVVVSLTLSPALAGQLMRHGASGGAFGRWFNRGFDRLSNGYARLTGWLIRRATLVVLVYIGLIVATVMTFQRTPTGFIPDQDKGYFIAAVQLPPGSSVTRTRAVLEKLSATLLAHPAVEDSVGFAGFDGATFTQAPNGGAIFVTLKPFEERSHSVGQVIGEMWPQVGQVSEGNVFLLQPPPVDGLGNATGWKLYLQDRQGRGLRALEEQTNAFLGALNQNPALSFSFSLFNTNTPRVFADIDLTKAEMLGVTPQAINATLEVYLGSAYVNDFNILGRTYRVTAQADAEFRDEPLDIETYRAPSVNGSMVQLGAVADVTYTSGPSRVPRYNLYASAEIQGDAAPGVSSTAALDTVEAVAAEVLADGFSFEWTDLSYQQRAAGSTAALVFGLSVLFVFLVLAALYESWVLPFAVILIVPMCLLAALLGVGYRGLDNNILTQVGLIVLIGLASKNAILIVEFARQAYADGKTRSDAAIEAARLRLRPILMTSLAFILGVVPLVIASGAGAELRQALGTAVFAGMVGVTFFGLIFTPVFYVLMQGLSDWLGGGKQVAQGDHA